MLSRKAVHVRWNLGIRAGLSCSADNAPGIHLQSTEHVDRPLYGWTSFASFAALHHDPCCFGGVSLQGATDSLGNSEQASRQPCASPPHYLHGEPLPGDLWAGVPFLRPLTVLQPSSRSPANCQIHPHQVPAAGWLRIVHQ